MEEFENLAGFLEHVSLVMENAEGNPGEMVSIMTLHSAKGLEFDVVFLPGWEEGLFPHQRALDENGAVGLEEERRLAYAGLTRAKRRASSATPPTAASTTCGRARSLALRRGVAAEHIERASGCRRPRSLARVPCRRVSPEAPGGFAPMAGRSQRLWSGRPGAVIDVPMPAARRRCSYSAGARVFHQKFGYGEGDRRRWRQARHRLRQGRHQEGDGRLRRARRTGALTGLREEGPEVVERPRGRSASSCPPSARPNWHSAVEAVLEPVGRAAVELRGRGGQGLERRSAVRAATARASLVRSALKAIGAPPAAIAYVPPKNWVAETQRLLAPLRIGRFFIHGAHFQGRPAARRDPAADRRQHRLRHRPAHETTLRLPAGARSLGAGRRAHQAAARPGLRGAASRRWRGASLGRAGAGGRHRPGTRCAVARENLRINRAASRVRVVRVTGSGAAAVRRAAPFDLIVAKYRVAGAAVAGWRAASARNLAPGGTAILSGLMNDQEPQVIAAQ